ncbi:MAG: hypothetical protein JNJ41_19245 [Bacteroidia bacterium]|nr:hypothetical protein [Bacteroidia bacterium]
MKQLLLYSLFLLISCNIFGQVTLPKDSTFINPKKNAIYLEAGGTGGFYSVCYDRIVAVKRKRKDTFSIGASYAMGSSLSANDLQIFTLPFSRNSIYNNFLELGLGFTPGVVIQKRRAYHHGFSSDYTEISPLFLFVPKLGLRYQKNTGGIFLRAAFTPLISVTNSSFFSSRFFPWGGLSAGWSF